VAVQLRREHLDRGARDRDADLAVGLRQGPQEPMRVRCPGSAGDAEEDAHTDRLCRSNYLLPLEASRNAAICLRRAAPSPANDGIGDSEFTHAGHFRCATWKAMPLFFAPSAVNSGAPANPPPRPR